MLDTSAVIALMRGTPAAVRSRLQIELGTGAKVEISSVVLFELWHGVARSLYRAENAARLREFLSGEISVSAFNASDATIAGELRAALADAGTTIGPYDLLIAAQALERRATIVTSNVGEFSRVSGLLWENWSA